MRRPNEIHEDGTRETMRAFIIPASSPPFMVRRVNYMDTNGTGLFDSPQAIEEWEVRYGKGT